MIPAIEIKSIARSQGVPESSIERDYAQNWFLGSLSSSWKELVLKGGTGIRKAYVEGYRFSDDLDFTMLKDIDYESAKDLILEAIIKTKEESGIDIDETVELKENINGFEGKVYFRLLRSSGSPIGIKLDLTKPEMEKVMLPSLEKKIIHPYSDERGFEVRVYSLMEIAGEKIRSLFERTPPRDLYDVWYFKDEWDDKDISDIFMKKCRFKNLDPIMDSVIERRDDFRNSWKNSLSHQLKELPDFDDTFNSVTAILKGLL